MLMPSSARAEVSLLQRARTESLPGIDVITANSSRSFAIRSRSDRSRWLVANQPTSAPIDVNVTRRMIEPPVSTCDDARCGLITIPSE